MFRARKLKISQISSPFKKKIDNSKTTLKLQYWFTSYNNLKLRIGKEVHFKRGGDSTEKTNRALCPVSCLSN